MSRAGTECPTTGKKRYRDKYEATSTMRRIWRRVKNGKLPTRAYFCHFCQGYHLTSAELRKS